MRTLKFKQVLGELILITIMSQMLLTEFNLNWTHKHHGVRWNIVWLSMIVVSPSFLHIYQEYLNESFDPINTFWMVRVQDERSGSLSNLVYRH